MYLYKFTGGYGQAPTGKFHFVYLKSVISVMVVFFFLYFKSVVCVMAAVYMFEGTICSH